jgi:phosphoglycolate phosphatase
MTTQTIIFDLDGTLVDSAPGILAAYQIAFDQCGLQPKVPLESGLIGPPLRDTMAMVAGYPGDEEVNQLLTEFKKAYDDQGCLKTPSFEGVEEMMRALTLQGIRLFIATNKRAYPTHKIMQHLGWTHFFEGVYGPDSFEPAKPNKAALIQQILQDHQLNADTTVYVGDRNEDGDASHANNLAFLFASWGYGQDHNALEQHGVNQKKGAAATSKWTVATTPDSVLTLALA